MALMVKNPTANAGDIKDMGSTPGLGRCPGGGRGNPFQYSCLENAIKRLPWWATAHRVAESDMTEVTALMHGDNTSLQLEGMGGGRSQRGDPSEVLNTQHRA